MALTQFSLRSLLAAVAAVGIGAALWVAEPSWQVGAIEFVLLAWLLAAVLILAANSTGMAKAWWTGIAVVCIFTSFVCLLTLFVPLALFSDFPDSPLYSGTSIGPIKWFIVSLSECFRSVLIALLSAPLVGLLCVLTNWLLIRPPEPKA